MHTFSPAFDAFSQWVLAVLPFSALMLVVILALGAINKYLTKQAHSHRGFQFRRQLIFSGAVIVGMIILLIAVPINEALRGQLFSLLGIMVSAIIALSSTTIVGNIMAGFMLRSINSFNIGDFVKIGGHFGRVSEIDMLHIEIQTEDRDLQTLPNLFLINQPLTVIHSAGTIISSELSLGYDVDRIQVEKLLIEAATDAGLNDPFVQIMALGDFSVNYRVGGMLNEVKHLISSRSVLRTKIMDHLHRNGIEIASPTLMNQRQFTADTLLIPANSGNNEVREQARLSVEDMVFDKAERATKIARLRQRLEANLKKLGELAETTKDNTEDKIHEKGDDKNAGKGSPNTPVNRQEKLSNTEKAALYQQQNERLRFWLEELEKVEKK